MVGHWSCLEQVEHTTMEEVKIGSMVDKYGYHMELWRKFLVEVDSDYGWFDSGLG